MAELKAKYKKSPSSSDNKGIKNELTPKLTPTLNENKGEEKIKKEISDNFDSTEKIFKTTENQEFPKKNTFIRSNERTITVPSGN